MRFLDPATERTLRELVAETLFTKGVTLGDLKRHEEAINVYDELVRRFGAATEPTLRKWVTKAKAKRAV